jgi:hypothetical protein
MSDSMDVNFQLLPPRLQVSLWVVGLGVDSRRVNIANRYKSFVTGVECNYGVNIDVSL